jgi:hypothetical protein
MVWESLAQNSLHGSIRKLKGVAKPNNKIEQNKIMPLLFILMEISMNHEILRHYTLELFGNFIVLC